MPIIRELENLPVTSSAFSRIANAYASVADKDPTSEPPKKSPRLQGQQTVYPRSAAAKGKGRAQDNVAGLAMTSRPCVYRIHNMPARTSLPQVYSNELLPTLERTINTILDPNPRGTLAPGISYESAYQACQVLVTLRHEGENICRILENALKHSVSSTLTDVHRKAEVLGIHWLEFLVEKWQWFEDRLNILHAILVHLDRHFIDSSPGQYLRVRDLGRHMWRNRLSSKEVDAFRVPINEAVVEWSTRERDDDLSSQFMPNSMQVDDAHGRSTIKKFIGFAGLTDLYTEQFLDYYQFSALEYYEKESSKLSESLTPAQYLLHAARRVEQEVQRLKDCCPDSPWGRVLDIVDDELIRPHVKDDSFCAEALSELMREANIDGLKELYVCYLRVRAIAILRLAFKDHVKKTVVGLVKDLDRDPEMITNLLTFKALVDDVLAKAFTGTAELNYEFTIVVKDAFRSGLSERKNKPAEMLAKYLDAELRRGQQGVSEKDFENKLDSALALHGFLQDKDVFRIFFMRALAKRLLLQRSASDDFEKAFLVKLGRGFDSEFEKGLKMFEDLTISRSLMVDFHEKYPEDANFSAYVFQPSNWPTYSPAKLTLPAEMQPPIVHFNEFYPKLHSNRKLTWIHSLGTVTLVARYPKGEKELIVSLFQALVLLAFNGGVDRLKFKEIRERIDLDRENLERTVQSLALGKKRVLLKRPATKEIGEDDEILFNKNFEDKGHNVRINTIQVQETVEENKATEKEIGRDRDFVTDAAIVRIMKASKKRSHEELLVETIKVVERSFKLQPRFFKKRVDALIGQDYMVRDGNDLNLYHYVA